MFFYSLLLIALPAVAAAASFSLTDAHGLGPLYAGIGGLSGGGATSRLLIDYPPSTRSQIFDLLFKPNFGASLQLLKIEVGGDGQSTEGTEPSHAHSVDDLNFHRGYEWTILEEAKARNPTLGTLALSWSWPAWVGCPGGDLSSPACDAATPYTYPQQSAAYIVSFVKGARDVHNVSIDIVSSWNEKAYNADFLVALRDALDAEGLSATRIVCDDYNWACAEGMMANPALFEAVDFISGHDGMPPSAQAPSKPLYDTEGFHTVGSDAGAASWISELNTRYINFNQTMNIAWNLIAAYYEGTAFWPHGLMHAWQPWVGWYSVPASIWATAHYTQFTTRNAFHYTLVDPVIGGSGVLAEGGTYVSLINNATGEWTIVIEKQPNDARSSVAPETAQFMLGGRFAAASRLAVWSTQLAVAGGALANESKQFVQLPQITVANGSFSVDLAVGQILTITTLLEAGFKGSFPPPPPPAAFPDTYSDDFNACAIDAQARYVTDFNGVTTCEDSGDPSHGVVMRQVVPKAPIRWWADTRPHAVLGNPTWRDVAISIDFRCTSEGGSAMVGARASIESATFITDGPAGIHAEDELRGLWYSVTCAGGANGGGGEWALWPSVKQVAVRGSAIAEGKLGGVPVNTWHTLRLTVNGSHAEGGFDGARVFGVDVSKAGTPLAGFAGFGTIAFGDFTQFDNVATRATAARCSAAGAALSPVAVWPCNAASPGQQWAFSAPLPTSAPWAPLALASNPGLCLTVAATRNKYGSYELIVDACASPVPSAQLFSFNAGNGTLTTPGGADMKPGASICVDVTAAQYSVGNGLDVYPCQPAANQQWRLLEGGLLSSGDPAEFYCAGACA